MALMRCLLLASLGTQLVHAKNITTESSSSVLSELSHPLEPLVAHTESTAASLEAPSLAVSSQTTTTTEPSASHPTSETGPSSSFPIEDSSSPSTSTAVSTQAAPAQQLGNPPKSPTSQPQASSSTTGSAETLSTGASSAPNTLQAPKDSTSTPQTPTSTRQDISSLDPLGTTPDPTQITPEPVVTHGHNQLLPSLLSHFAALFAKTEQSAEYLDVPGPSTAEPLIDSILSQVIHPFAAVTASSSNDQLEGPAAFAPVIGGGGSQPTSAPSVGGIIASVMDSLPASPGAQGAAVAQQTQSPTPPGQLVNVASPNGSQNNMNKNTGTQQQNNKVSQVWVIGTETITPGSPAQVISGTTYSLASDSASIFVNDIPHNVYAGTNSNSDNVPFILPGSNTVQPGGSAVTLSGTTYSLSPHGSTLYINGVATILPPSPTNPPFIVDGHTITPGSQATVIDGQTYSVAAATAGGALYVNGTKIAEPQNFALLTMAMSALENVIASTTASPSSFDGMLTLASTTASVPVSTTSSRSDAASTPSNRSMGMAGVVLGAMMALGLLL